MATCRVCQVETTGMYGDLFPCCETCYRERPEEVKQVAATIEDPSPLTNSLTKSGLP